jgi:hypothetical protein
MTFSVTPVIGTALLDKADTNLNSAGTAVPVIGPLGLQVWGANGRRYVLAQANATITASTATCTVNATTFLVTATAGSYTSPPVALATGDVAWFSATSV